MFQVFEYQQATLGQVLLDYGQRPGSTLLTILLMFQAFEYQQATHGRNTLKVLQDYGQRQGSTVNEVIKALKEIERPDALQEVEDSLPGTVMILSFRIYRLGQTVQTQIRLLLEEQSDQGLHCLLFNLHLLDNIA